VKPFRILFYLSAGLAMAQTAADPAATAKKALDLLLGGKYQELAPLFTADMQKAYPADSLAKLRAEFGPVKEIEAPSVQKIGVNTIVVFPVHFDSKNYNFRYIVNRDGLVAGMFPLPAGAAWQAPAYVKAGSFQEREVTIGDDEWKLPGTLTVPAGSGPFPGVVLVQGSGPHDRDETVGGTKVFKDLAEGLASQGIAVLRYEKRTRQYSAKMAGLHGYTIEDETVEDAARAAAVLRAQKEIDPAKIYVLGHSLGGYAAPRIAEEDGKLAGLIVLAAYARPLEDEVVEQAENLGVSAKDLAAVKAQAMRVKSLEDADADGPPLLGMSVPYLLDLKGYDPVAEARKLPIRMLFLQGERDFEVPMKDFALWKAGLGARKDVTFQSFPTLNHLFVAGEGKSTEAEYRKAGHVAPEVIDAIAKWVKQ
jgi:dienelactone hydrolase